MPVEMPTAVVHQFLAIAEQAPGSAAIDEAGRTTSYGELARRARTVAAHLQRLGIGADDIVAIDLARSTEAIVAMIGAQLVGAAYLSLGPHLPDARVQTILGESAARVMLSISTLRRGCALALPALMMDALPSCVEPDPPLPAIAANDLAYVIFTSGSTGTPKGVAIEHASLGHLCSWFGDYFKTTPQDRFSHLATLSFDASVWEVWPALTCGGCLCIADEQTKRSPNDLLDWLTEQAVSVSWQPTVLAAEICRMSAALLAKPRALRVLTAAGEKLSTFAPPELACALYNCYGPSEDTVCTTVARVPHADQTTDTAPSIGQPIAGKGVLLLSADGQAVEDGEVGELMIHGPGLARGYLNRPDLTAERFLSGAAPDGHVRMFRTGDLAYRDSIGNLHFVGRSDGQVSIYGYRVELGEVEHALLRDPAVRSAIVVVDDSTSRPALVAHVVATAGAAPSAEVLRQHLQGSLSDYMVPARVFFYDAFPVTRHDKVDRRALRRLASVQPSEAAVDLPALLKEMLGDDVDMESSFLASGGNSVAAIRLIAELKARHGAHVSLQELFALPRLSSLEERIVQAPSRGSDWAIEPRDRQARLAASPSQELVWFLNKLEPQNPAYIAKAMVFLRGRIDPAALHASLQDVINRHEIYRTRFSEDGEGLVQVVEERADVELLLHEEAMEEADLNARSAELMTQLLGAPFDLEQLPLARFALVRVAPELHVLLHAEHHIVHDGWSYNEFLRDLFAYYRYRTGAGASPAGEVYQFGDFSASLRAWMETPAADQQRDYWRDKLAGAPALLELPTDNARAASGFNGATLRAALSRETWKQCETVARRLGVTPFALVLAVFSVVLGRHAGSQDVCVGSGFANRSWGNAERILGMVINTVVLRNAFKLNQSFDAFLANVGRTVTEALAHQELPFADVVKCVNPVRQRGVNPLFQVFMGFHDAHLAEFGLGARDVQVLEALGNSASKFDLSLVVIPRTGQVDGEDPVHLVWEYNTALFSHEFAQRLLRSFLGAMDAVLATPSLPVGQIPLVAPEDRKSLIELLCPPPKALPAWKSLDRQVERLAMDHPERMALQCVDESLSYGQLAQRVADLAHRLARAGVRPADRVAVGLRRRCNMVATLLAIHRLGASYVPVDPRYPAERLRFILQDVDARLLVTESAVADAFGEVVTPVLTLDGQQPGTADETDVPLLEATVTDTDRAYVLYTSGSTGRPKGVAVSHAAFANFTHAIVERIGLSSHDCLVAVTSLSFDIAGLELLIPLTLGARVVIADEETTFDGGALRSLIARESATVMQATPATWRLLLQAGWRADGDFTALCGGEAMPAALAVALVAAGASTHNLYGPTETTVWSTTHRVLAASGPSVPLGRPIANTQLFVLDDSMNLVPQGSVGQLYIGGLGLAQGYFGNHELTSQRFIANPHRDLCPWSSARLYATGDLVRLDERGDLHYLSRGDDQIKLRGYRIELGEIEAALESHPDVASVAAQVVTGDDGEGYLVAHVVPASAETTFDCAPLIAHAKTRLPSYMVPRVLATTSSLPLTPNGKLDRKALPVIAAREAAAAHVSARNPSEAIVLEEVARVVQRDGISVTDDFFALGGHSLQLSSLLNGINGRTGAALRIRDVFTASTIAALAALVAKQSQAEEVFADQSTWDDCQGEELTL